MIETRHTTSIYACRMIFSLIRIEMAAFVGRATATPTLRAANTLEQQQSQRKGSTARNPPKLEVRRGFLQ